MATSAEGGAERDVEEEEEEEEARGRQTTAWSVIHLPINALFNIPTAVGEQGEVRAGAVAEAERQRVADSV